jgi:hypothetical protein
MEQISKTNARRRNFPRKTLPPIFIVNYTVEDEHDLDAVHSRIVGNRLVLYIRGGLLLVVDRRMY